MFGALKKKLKEVISKATGIKNDEQPHPPAAEKNIEEKIESRIEEKIDFIY